MSRIVKLLGLVNSTPTFTEHHLVTNGCSELLGEVFGPQVGAHARSAFGVAQIPHGRLRRDRDDRRSRDDGCHADRCCVAAAVLSFVGASALALVTPARVRHAAVPVVRAAAPDLRRHRLLPASWRWRAPRAGGAVGAAAVRVRHRRRAVAALRGRVVRLVQPDAGRAHHQRPAAWTASRPRCSRRAPAAPKPPCRCSACRTSSTAWRCSWCWQRSGGACLQGERLIPCPVLLRRRSATR